MPSSFADMSLPSINPPQLARELYKIDPGLVQAVPGYEQLDADLRTPHRTDKSPPDAAHSTDTQYAQAQQAPRHRLESPVTTYTGTWQLLLVSCTAGGWLAVLPGDACFSVDCRLL